MGKDTEYKKYDSHDTYQIAGARLAKDPESRDGEHGKMVRLTVVSTSRKDTHSDLWLEINVGDFHAEAASFLQKGDTVHLIRGKPCLRRFGDDNEKFSFVIDRADVIIPIELLGELKERGFVPGQKSASGGAKGGKPTKGKAAPAAKGKGAPAKGKKPVPVAIPDDDDDDVEIDEDDDE